MVSLPERTKITLTEKKYFRRLSIGEKFLKKPSFFYLQPFTILGNLPMGIVIEYAIYAIGLVGFSPDT